MNDDPLEGARSAWNGQRYEACIAGALLTIAECLNAVTYSERIQVDALANVYGDGSGPIEVEVRE